MATKLGVYNGCLRELGETRLENLSEAREPRFTLDEHFLTGVRYCLEQGQWNFATRAIEVEADTNVEPTFGYDHAFEKPDDIVRIMGVSSEPTFQQPLEDYLEEGGYWYANVAPIYVRYVSDDDEYGLDLSEWPETFTLAVETWLASLIVGTVKQSQSDKAALVKLATDRLLDAASKDAQRSASKRMPVGSWNRSFHRGRDDGR